MKTNIFSDLHISIADIGDTAIITLLLNSAYRGESSRRGWTTEADLIGGEVRTIETQVQDLINQPDSVFLKYNTSQIVGCVNLQQHYDKIYLGMLSVNPNIQNSGIGKKLMVAAEEYAKYKGCKAIYMQVIDVREELINWYKRHGYNDTGKRIPFVEDGISGNHLKTLQFMVLEKKL